ncbi:MAG: ATP-binding protein [Armatimonadetes bacterium]|nr:ATP-binding protein [Armatimonadota bacterium]
MEYTVTYITRTLEPVVRKAVEDFPAVVLSGPRQSGKTTLLKRLLGDRYRYVSMELPDVRASASADPRGFLEINSPPVILDEIQYAPELLFYIKERIDADRSRKGQFVLTGSQNLLMMSQVTESLAGRSAILKLLPLSLHEISGISAADLPWEPGYTERKRPASLEQIWEQFLRGGYPELAAEPERDPGLWYSGYVQTYLERDVRSLRQVGDLTQFQSFLRVIAARSGQLLNLSDVSRDLGLAVNTAKSWLSILESTYQVVILRPYFMNIGKRLVKTPKVYLTDVGMLCHLAGLRDHQHAQAGPLSGAIVETAVLSEIVKNSLHRGTDPQAYFWRTSNGVEVDIVVEQSGRLVPVEVKATSTPRPRMASGLLAFMRDYPDRVDTGWLVHLGGEVLPMAPGVTALPFAEM